MTDTRDPAELGHFLLEYKAPGITLSQVYDRYINGVFIRFYGETDEEFTQRLAAARGNSN